MSAPQTSRMRCAVLGSGSSGNATVIQAAATAVLVDCGYSIKELETRAAALGFALETLNGILVTHEHDDHIGGVSALARKYGIPIFATRGTRNAQEARQGPLAEWQQISPHEVFQLGDLEIQAVPVPHDAREPSQFIFRHADTTLGVLTDLGTITPHVVEQYRDCDALLLEFNHDPDLLASAVYPARLKRRIAGAYGHLSNAQAQSLLKQMSAPKLTHVIAAHLSERTNNPETVELCLQESSAASNGFKWTIAAQREVTPWFEVMPVDNNFSSLRGPRM